eukprot:TRINITY_DN10518_c0_g1_i1.p3 TRINITY_DN10518_c0_g1~~TRINITY_DN10518_c0_g1_i1.p3  ORF type:complete len:168 (-),score=11.76 TRINITY_DN10518_c0_g1_i1:156-659(-)
MRSALAASSNSALRFSLSASSAGSVAGAPSGAPPPSVGGELLGPLPSAGACSAPVPGCSALASPFPAAGPSVGVGAALSAGAASAAGASFGFRVASVSLLFASFASFAARSFSFSCSFASRFASRSCFRFRRSCLSRTDFAAVWNSCENPMICVKNSPGSKPIGSSP